MADERGDKFGREARETALKSSLTGVAVTVLAVTMFSPQGMGGFVGDSNASGRADSSGADNPYAELPAFPTPFTADDIAEARATLAEAGASMDQVRDATDSGIAQVRAIAAGAGELRSFQALNEPTPMPVVPTRQVEHRFAAVDAEPAAVVEPEPIQMAELDAPAEVLELTQVVEAAPVVEEAPKPEPVSYISGGAAEPMYPDPDLELASLMFAHDKR